MTRKAEVGIWILVKDLTKQAFGGLRTSLGGLKNAFFSLQTLITSIVAGVAVKIGIDWVKAWGEAQQSVIKLNSTLRQTGRYSPEISKAIQQNAADLQRVTTAGDDAIVAATATLATLADSLTGPELIAAQQALIGLADQFFGGDLESAATMLGKTIGSTTNALTRYGIEVDANASQQEKLQQVLARTGLFFENSKASAEGVTGRLEQMKEVLGDTKEQLGAIITDLLGFEEGMGNARDRVFKLNAELEENRNQIVAWGKVALKVLAAPFITIGKFIQLAVDAVGNFAMLLQAAFHGVVAGIFTLINGAIGAVNLFIKGLNQIPGVEIGEIGYLDAAGQLELAGSRFDDAAEAGTSFLNTLQDIGDAWLGIVDAAGEATAAQKGALGVKPGAGPNIPRQRIAPPKEPDRPQLIEAWQRTPEEWAALQEQFRQEQQAQMTELDLPEEIDFSRTWDFATGLEESLGLAGDLDDLLLNITDQTLTGFGDAVTSAFAAMADGSKKAGEAFRDGMLGAIAAVAGGLGKLFLGQAVEEFAKALSPEGWPTAGAHIASGMKHMAAAGLMFALGGIAQGTASRGGGGGAGAAARHSKSLADTQGEATLIIEGGFLDMNDPRQADQLARALGQLSGRRVTVRGR